MVPLMNDVDAFMARFGVDVYSIYNMTELCCPVMTTVPMTVPGSAGRVRPGCELRVVDANDCEVPTGAVGEIVVRADTPWAINHGYYREPEATARAWRNGWFHTGDAGRMDADGNLYFVDRLKDTIRRRGENISSLEVETEVAAHAAVREAAVIPVPSELGEDEVMAVVSLRPGAGAPAGGAARVPGAAAGTLHDPALRADRGRAAEDADREGREAQAARRGELRLTAWDREAAGVRIRRERLGSTRVSAPVPEALRPETALRGAPPAADDGREQPPLSAARGAAGLPLCRARPALLPRSARRRRQRLPAPPPGCWAGSPRSFALYGARTVLRHRTCLRVSEEGIAVDGAPAPACRGTG